MQQQHIYSERYQRNRDYFKTLNLLRYHRKLNHEDKVTALSNKLNTLSYVNAPRKPRREQTTAQLFPECTKLTTKRVRLLNRIRSKQAQHYDVTDEVEQLKNIMSELSNMPNEMKPKPNVTSVKAKNNAAYIQELLKSR